jgi:acetyl esterase/lipase
MASVRARIVRMIIESFSTRPWRDSARPSFFRRILAAVSQGGEQTVAERRLQMERLSALNPAPRGTRHQKVTANGVPAAWIWSRSAARDHVVSNLHGGGYIAGSLKTHRTLAAYVSRAASARVLLIDYRLAPEYPFPAAVEDAANAYRWLLAQGYPPAHLAIAGDSAGGGLTVATMLALRDSGEGLPAAGVGLSPRPVGNRRPPAGHRLPAEGAGHLF